MKSDRAVPAFSIHDPELSWASLSQLPARPEAQWLRWLEDPGSLTAKLKALSACRFRVEVLKEDWIEVREAALLERFGPAASGGRFWSRQVCLLGCEQPWVLAHTLIPEASLRGPLEALLNLQDKPLGEYLFQQPDLKREALEVASLPGSGWARRTLFRLRQQPIMVAEAFLPALLAFNTRPDLSAGNF